MRKLSYLIRILLVIVSFAALLIGALYLANQVQGRATHRIDTDTRRISYAATATAIAIQLPPADQSPQETIVANPTVASETLITGRALWPQHNAYQLTNVLFVGSDRRDTSDYRADTIIVASLNHVTHTVNLLSIPRDLYVNIPGVGMERINTAAVHELQGALAEHPQGLLAQTIESDLGIRIDLVVAIDFTGFETIIDLLGGVTIPVDCAVTGFWFSDETQAYEPFVIEPGLHDMDGETALWYVRQRIDSSDFDRSRRQQILLKALWQKVSNSTIITSLSGTWTFYTDHVETTISLTDVLGLVPLLIDLDISNIRSYFLGVREVEAAFAPNGAEVLMLNEQAFAETATAFLSPPTTNQLISPTTVTVLNASGISDADVLAAFRLSWQGFTATASGVTTDRFATTTLYDHRGDLRGAEREIVRRSLQLTEQDIITVIDSTYSRDFTLVIGDDYEVCASSPWEPIAQPIQ